MKLQAEEAAAIARPEQVSWFVMNRQAEGQFYVSKSENAVTHMQSEMPYATTNAGRPSFFAAMQTYNGPNTATLRATAVGEESAVVFVEEEQSMDDK